MMIPNQRLKRWNEVVVHKLLLKHTTPRITLAYAKIHKQTSTPVNSTYFQGEVSTGKTMLAIHSVMNICRENYINNAPIPNFMFINVSDLFSEIKATYDKNSDVTEMQIIDKYTNIDILILDDLGVVPVTPWVSHIMYIIINKLYENLKTLFITSNIPLSRLEEVFPDERVVRRIDAMCKVVICSEKYV